MNQNGRISYIGDEDNLRLTQAFHPELNAARDKALLNLQRLLQGMFDGIDDSFFELANHAHSNNEQNQYFEAMREIRIKRRGVENLFKQAVARLFAEPPRIVLSHSSEHGTPVVEEVSYEDLSLVQDDAMEESVAITSMSTKARANFTGLILGFQKRATSLMRKQDEGVEVNPLDPEQVCKAFAEACSELEIRLSEKLIVFKQFDRFVMANFEQVLEAANDHLVKAGIMPKLKAGSQRSPVRAKSSNITTDEAISGEQANTASAATQDVFPEVQRLFDALRSNAKTPLGGRKAPAPGSAAAIPAGDVIDMLSRIESRLPPVDFDQDTAWEPSVIDVRVALETILQAQEKDSGRALTQVDEDLINLVSMLFEFILEDYNLSPPIQVLISRLQIPILKVVIKDRSFFAQPSHPARRLLNALARAGIGWSDASEKKRDRLYGLIQSTVQTVLDDFDGDLKLFETLYNKFDNALAKEEKKSKLVERRTKETEEGRIKAQKAQNHVDDALNERLAQQPLPALIVDFLQDGWARVLFLAYLKNDTEHRWKQCLSTVDELIWCLQSHTSNEERQRWVRIVPILLKNIKIGLKEVSYGGTKLETTLKDIKRVLTETFKHQSRAAANSSMPEMNLVEVPKKEKPKTAVQKQGELEQAVMAEFLQKVDAIPQGSWIQFHMVNGSKFRCKLSTVVDGEVMIFVNRMGIKVVEKNRLELAHELRRERVQILQEGALLDRAMDAVVTKLKDVSQKIA